MKALEINGTNETPFVTLNKGKEIFEIGGKSLPENASLFYSDITNWLNNYSEDPNSKTIFNFRFIYFNTTSAKLLIEIFTILENINSNGHKVEIHWHSPDDDDSIIDAGEEFEDIINLPFKQIKYLSDD